MSEEASPRQAYRMIEPLTGLRAYAAFWALSRHFFLGNAYAIGFGTKVDLGPAYPIAIMGSDAIDIFFVLSGFVITYVYRARFADGLRMSELRRYFAARLGRIYPVHVAIIGAMAVGYSFDVLPWDNIPFDWAGLTVNLLMVQCWGFYPDLVWNRPSWTVSAEWFVYVLFPLFVVVFGSIRRARHLLLAIAAISVFYYLARWEIGGFTRGNLGPGSLMRATYGFLFGLFLHGLFRRRFLAHWNWDLVALAAIVILVAVTVLAVNGYAFPLSIYVPICLLVYSLTYARGFAARIFDNRVAVYLGEISYSIYLVHFPVLRALTYEFGPRGAEIAAEAGQPLLWLLTLAMVGIVIAVATVFYYLIELPCRNYVKRRVAV
jgi:peptidoglycan/LPS O-acetylase OafA/YrhL